MPTDSTRADAPSDRPPRDLLVRAMRPGAELRDSGTDAPPTMFGHFAVFDQWTEINSRIEGHFLERVAPGAFTKAFQEPARSRIKPVFQHGEDPELGDKILGPLAVVKQDKVGAYYEVPLYRGIPELLLEGMRGGEYGSSFKFRVTREQFDTRAKASSYNPDGLPERTVQEVEVYDFGPVTWPAYEGATVGVRSMTDDFMVKRLLRDPKQLSELLALVDAPSKPDAADEPHLGTERSEPPVVVAPVQPRFPNKEDFITWLASRI